MLKFFFQKKKKNRPWPKTSTPTQFPPSQNPFAPQALVARFPNPNAKLRPVASLATRVGLAHTSHVTLAHPHNFFFLPLSLSRDLIHPFPFRLACAGDFSTELASSYLFRPPWRRSSFGCSSSAPLTSTAPRRTPAPRIFCLAGRHPCTTSSTNSLPSHGHTAGDPKYAMADAPCAGTTPCFCFNRHSGELQPAP